MNTTQLPLEKIEELILQIAEKDFGSAQELCDILEPYQDNLLPERVKRFLADNLNIIMEDLDEIVKNSVIQKLLLNFSRLGVDAMSLRDALAAVSREVNREYPDPSGLIQALGIFDSKLNIQDIYHRWNVFSVLRENAIVWHSSYGLGNIVEIDAFSNLIYVEFQKKEHFNLVHSLTSFSVAKPGSLAESLKLGSKFSIDNHSPDELDRSIASDFVPPLSNPWQVIEELLVPKWLGKKLYLQWRNGQGMNMSKKNEKSQERKWNNARGMEELKICLAKVKSIKVTSNDSDHLRKIFRAEAVRPLSRFIFAEAISILWSYCPRVSWFVELIKELPEDTVAWTSTENFVEVTCKLSAKLVPNWFLISEIARSREWLVNRITELPFRFWPSTKHPLMAEEDFVSQLTTKALETFKNGEASCDTVLWLWLNARQEAEAHFMNPSLVVRTLSKPVKGEFQKAFKELYRLLLEDQEFQKALMDKGSPKGIASFSKIIKSTPILSKGEQQSLLVKIVRIYPEAQDIVAKKEKVVSTRAIAKTTSMRSFEERRLELEEIINVKIPKNSAAIAHARSYGDLRENAEFKAAKEQQRLLMARRHELERGLKEIIQTDFSDVCISETVIPGCSVVLTINKKNQEVYHILGLWDSDPDRNILSYDTPLGKILIGKRVGDTFTTPHSLPAEINAIKELPEEIKEWVKAPESNLEPAPK